MRCVRILTVGGAVVGLAAALVAAPTVSVGAAPGPVSPTVVDVGLPLVAGPGRRSPARRRFRVSWRR